jgi:DNA-binding CsgD family transcriptional regulator
VAWQLTARRTGAAPPLPASASRGGSASKIEERDVRGNEQDMVLYGRRQERARIAALLADARAGHAGVLVIRGESGIGKTTLLQDAADQASGFRLLRCTAVESEVELAFAALHQLLRPVLDYLDRLPAPQASAVRGAFGLVETQAETNRFLVEVGTLSLLTVVAAEQPLLCLVDDARFLDAASVDTLLFVARRLQAERLVVLFAARDGEARSFPAPGLPELRLGGLDPAAAGALLQTQVGELALEVRDRLIAEAGGNPLALQELLGALTSQQLAGHQLLPQRLPLTARLQAVFLERFRQLPQATQTLLLVAAAEDTGELATILAASDVLGVDKEALGSAEEAGLVQVVQVVDAQLVFRHPLVRSAVYQHATVFARRAAHRALVEVLKGGQQADRRAWHLAAATLDPDEDVAGALEASAGRARRRGGPAAAAGALERAAALTPEGGVRARRLVAAAEDRWEAGHPSQALALLEQVDPGLVDAAVRARLAHVWGAIELASGIPATACTLLLEGARPILASDPGRAIEMLALAAQAALAAGELDTLVHQVHPAVVRLNAQRPGREDLRVQRVADSLVAAGLVEAPAAVAAESRSGEAASTWPHPSFTWTSPMLVLVQPAVDDVTGDQLAARLVEARRAAGTVSALTVALANLMLAEASLGQWHPAIDDATEGLRLAIETGQDATAAYFAAWLAWFAAFQGRADECRRLAEEALAVALPRRLVGVAAFAAWALAMLELAEGRPAAALERLRAVATPGHPTAYAPVALLATRDLVEAAAQAGALAGVEPLVARFERWARADQRPWTLVVARRLRALVTQGPAAEQHYRAALAVEGAVVPPVELARSELLYGRWLRRARRRSDARVHLRAARELYERLGATPWAERARAELRASGEKVRSRDPATLQQLTPQERQVASLAAQGLSNQQIADQLFVSRHTVSYHLHKVYAKLGITSRAELGRLDLEDGGSR